jgi:hypothetical protein
MRGALARAVAMFCIQLYRTWLHEPRAKSLSTLTLFLSRRMAFHCVDSIRQWSRYGNMSKPTTVPVTDLDHALSIQVREPSELGGPCVLSLAAAVILPPPRCNRLIASRHQSSAGS